MNIHIPVTPASERLGWRLTYVDGAATGYRFASRLRRQMTGGWPGQPVLTAVAVDDLLAQSTGGRLPSLDVIWGGSPSSSVSDLELQLNEWINTEPATCPRVVRASVRTIRIVWSTRRAYFFCAADAVDDVLDALSRFTVLAWKTQELEQEMKSVWPAIDSQRPLLQATAKFRSRDLRALAGLTDRVNRMNSEILKVDPVLDQLDAPATILSKRVFSELSEQAALEDRLDLVEEPIDHAVDHCELLNDRVIEGRNAASSRSLESAIIALLVVEVALSGYYLLSDSGLLPPADTIVSAVRAFIG